MRKWEAKYEEYKNGEPKIKFEKYELSFDELSEKVNNNLANQKEVKAYNKMKRIYGYLPQVENLKDAIGLLNDRMEILREEANARVNKARIKKLEAEIEVDRKNYLKDQENGKENFDELVKVQDKEIKLNDMKQRLLQNHENSEFSEMSNEELKNEILATKSQISKCHLAARCFMEGYSKENIDIKVNKEWKNRRFTSKENLSKNKNIQDKKEDVNDKDKTADDEDGLGTTTVIKSGMKPVFDDINQNMKDNSEQNTTALVDQNEIREVVEEAHPWLTRFSKLPLLGNRASKKLDEFIQSEMDRREKIAKAQEKAQAKAQVTYKEKIKSEKTLTQEFKAKYSLTNYDVMDIAEKGVEGLDDERINNAKLRYEEMKKRAQDPNRYQIDENGVKHDNMGKTTKEDKEER